MIYIWVRATTNWADEQAFRAQLGPMLERKVELWNATFNIPYHLFRHRVSEIARANVARVENSTVAGWDEIPEGALVVPVDDDDWFAPDACRVLESERDPGATAYHWPSSFIEVPIHVPHRLGLIRRRIFPSTPPKYVFTTNNYAMVKAPATERLLRRHVRASVWAGRQGPGVVKRIENRLSVMNRTLASQTSLALTRPTISRARLIWKFHRYRWLYRHVSCPSFPGLGPTWR